MTTYTLEAKDNYEAAESAAFHAGLFPYISLATNAQLGTAYDPVRRTLFYSRTYWSDGLDTTNATGHRVWTGVVGFNAGATYSPDNYNNFSIVSKNIDTDLVTRYNAYDPASTVPNGIGGSDGTARRFTEADATRGQGIKITDPRTGNIWSHHVSTGSRTCLLYEFRAQDSYALTISPYVPSADRHLELFGISDNWVVFGDFEKNTTGRYTLECAPRLRQADEVAADYILSYGSFEMPSAFDGLANAPIRVCVDLNGNYWFLGARRGAGSRNYRLAKFTPPAIVANPAAGGSVTDITPWTLSTGPNSDAGNYTTASTATVLGSFILSNQISVYALHGADALVLINRLYPQMKNPVSADPADLKFQCTYVDMNSLAYTFMGSFITGYMTASWVMTTDPMRAAYAIEDMRETDLYRDYNGYDYSANGIDHASRWFAVVVRPVTGGVVGDTTTYRVVMVQYRFAPGEAPTLVRFIDEGAAWDPRYPTYAAALGNGNIIYNSMTGNAIMVLGDTGIWDAASSAFWYSGVDPADSRTFNRFDAYYANREAEFYVAQPFMRLSLTASSRGDCQIRYGDRL